MNSLFAIDTIQKLHSLRMERAFDTDVSPAEQDMPTKPWKS